jgi:hypothetical protein
VVFICFDVESYERSHSQITEIGIATLDTRDLINLPPGEDGENWRSKIRARHFRINENLHLRNYEFVQGCPDRFEFGESKFVDLEEVGDWVRGVFRPPFAALEEDGGVALDGSTQSPDDARGAEQRNIVILGHDIQTDLDYLRKVGVDATTLPNVIDCLDSATLYRAWTREPQIRSLGKILLDFDIVGWNLHNAGNDAVYTIQAMLAVCVHEGMIRGQVADVDATPEKEKKVKQPQEDDEDIVI